MVDFQKDATDFEKKLRDRYDAMKSGADESPWKGIPLSLSEFIAHEEHMNFPQITAKQMATLRQLLGDDPTKTFTDRIYETGVFAAGKGSGKDLISCIALCYVSHYVRPKSVLDAEAQKRATSIYLVDRTIPMLPEALSNNLCSLVPHQDRFTFSAVFILDEHAHIKERWFGKTYIHSDHRFTYASAQEVLDTGNGPHAEELRLLEKLGKKLRRERYHF
jgi:exoribonuclease II